ncbi:hypothetical protein CAMSH0001_0448 [Campylobacter showae RM3277]|uniref:Uncharacterized protein n=1 Tax=Campylobacter showae RM3277 TaxID=553219 RepID=C6RFE3_9BACT|nr:hypothetical protein CAMSH0001_0448 [Campylobacter showae RM3277]
MTQIWQKRKIVEKNLQKIKRRKSFYLFSAVFQNKKGKYNESF